MGDNKRIGADKPRESYPDKPRVYYMTERERRFLAAYRAADARKKKQVIDMLFK